MRLVLLGAPGSGKGTQGDLLARREGVPTIVTGDLLRAEMAAATPLGTKAGEYVNAGSLVPDDLILAMMEGRLKQPDVAQGFILDGFPRSIPQAEGLDRLLAGLDVRLDAVLKLDVPKKILLERMVARRICPNCAAVYNLQSSPPRVAGKCDRCGSLLTQREDDKEETVRKRLNVYEAATAPLIDYYDARGLLVIVSGEGKIREIGQRIERALSERVGKGRSESAV